MRVASSSSDVATTVLPQTSPMFKLQLGGDVHVQFSGTSVRRCVEGMHHQVRHMPFYCKKQTSIPQTGSIEYAYAFMGLDRAGPSVNRLMTALALVDSR